MIRLISTMLIIGSFFAASISSCANSNTDLKTDDDKISYSIGMDIGKNFKNMQDSTGLEIQVEAFTQGFKNAYLGEKTILTEEEARKVIEDFRKNMMSRHEEKQKASAEKNQKEGEKFLTQNKTKKGVQVTKSGLQYKVITKGKGPKPTAADQVKVHYKGTLIDGTVFDSSYARKQPAQFGVKGVIKGWTEALQLMPVGSKWELVIPADLAYGKNGAGQKIGPNATLIFEIELLEIINNTDKKNKPNAKKVIKKATKKAKKNKKK